MANEWLHTMAQITLRDSSPLKNKNKNISCRFCILMTTLIASPHAFRNFSAGYIGEFHYYHSSNVRAIVSRESRWCSLLTNDWWTISLETIYTGFFPGIQPHPKYWKALRIASGAVSHDPSLVLLTLLIIKTSSRRRFVAIIRDKTTRSRWSEPMQNHHRSTALCSPFYF